MFNILLLRIVIITVQIGKHVLRNHNAKAKTKKEIQNNQKVSDHKNVDITFSARVGCWDNFYQVKNWTAK